MSVSAQVRAALGVLLILLLAILAAAFYVPYTLNATANERYVEDVIPLQALVQDLVVETANQQTAVQAFVLTRDPRALERLEAAQTAVNDDLAAMRPHVARHPRLDPRVRRGVVQIANLQGLLAREVLLVEQGAEKPAARARSAEVNRAFDEFRKTAALMLLDTKTFVQEAKDDQRATYRRMLVALALLGAVAIGIGAALLVLTPLRLGQLYSAEQQARREAESRADAARSLEHVSDGVILSDSGGRLRFWNPAAAELLGLNGAGVVGRKVDDVLPAWEAVTTRMQVATTLGASVVVPLELPQGERWVAVKSVDFGEGTVYAIRDVTEERAFETMRNDLVATASHELRTPMTSIYGAARTLLRSDLDLSLEQRRTFLEMIVTESERLSRIVEDILLASRLDADRVEVASERCDVDSLARSVLAAAQVHAPPNIGLKLAPEPDLPDVACDPDRLRQVLVNMVDNAIKYSPNGGDVVLALSQNGEKVRFEVRDEGLGFPETERERIFERFHRLDPGLTRGIGGTGLGLYICRELVERMNGDIWAESAPGSGATFTVELPLAR